MKKKQVIKGLNEGEEVKKEKKVEENMKKEVRRSLAGKRMEQPGLAMAGRSCELPWPQLRQPLGREVLPVWDGRSCEAPSP